MWRGRVFKMVDRCHIFRRTRPYRIVIKYCIPKFVGAGSPSILSPTNNLDKPALTQQTTPKNISNTGLNLMNFDFLRGARAGF